MKFTIYAGKRNGNLQGCGGGGGGGWLQGKMLSSLRKC